MNTRNGKHFVSPTPPTEGGPSANATKARTWGDSLLSMPHRRILIEPAPIAQMSFTRSEYPAGAEWAKAEPNQGDYLTGELLTERFTRGNLKARDRATGDTFRLHPFAGAKAEPARGMSQYLKLEAPRRADTEFIQ